MTEAIAIYTFIGVNRQMWNYPNIEPMERFLGMLLCHFIFYMNFIYAYSILNIGCIINCGFLLGVHVIRLKIKEITKIVNDRATSMAVTVKLTLEYIHNMHVFNSVQKTYSQMLLFFLVCNIMLNISMVNDFIKSKGDVHERIFMVPLILIQFFVFIVLHLLAVDFSQLLFRPTKSFISKNVRVNKCFLRDRLKVSLFIQSYYTKKRYGKLPK